MLNVYRFTLALSVASLAFTASVKAQSCDALVAERSVLVAKANTECPARGGSEKCLAYAARIDELNGKLLECVDDSSAKD